MAITLVAGANKSIAWDAARRSVGTERTVYPGARDVGRGQTATGEVRVELARTNEGLTGAVVEVCGPLPC